MNKEQSNTAKDLVRFAHHLRSEFVHGEEGYRAANDWLRTPNKYLTTVYGEGKVTTPAELIRKGEVKKAEAALDALDNGTFV